MGNCGVDGLLGQRPQRANVLLGMLTRGRGNDFGNCVAMLCGFAAVIVLEIGGRQGWLPAIAFPWRVTVGTLVTFAVGCLFSTRTIKNGK